MAQPLAICIEDLRADEGKEPRFLQCVALVGSRGGLALDHTGRAIWEDAGAGKVCELWVSADGHLMLRVPSLGDDAALEAVTVSRLGRSLRVPADKPVVLKNGDALAIGERLLKLHIHGEAPAVHPPRPFVAPRKAAGVGRRVARAAAALALGTTVGAAGLSAEAHSPDATSDVIVVRNSPPDVAAPLPPPKKKPPKKKPTKKKPTKKKPAKKKPGKT